MAPPNQPKTIRLSVVLWSALIVVLAVAWFVLANRDRLAEAFGRPGAPAETEGAVPAETGAADAAALPAAAQGWARALGVDPSWPSDLADPADCESAEAAMTRLCRALDAEPPFSEARVAGGSCAALRDAIEAVAGRPPHVADELRTHAAMLDNVFHLFRAVGRERLALLRSAAAERPELAEPGAMILWRWAATREACARSGRTDVDRRALYEQAAFALDTIAGQAYLRRRSPRDEALATFYAVLAVERADLAGRNELGVDLRPAVARAAALLRDEDLVFTDRYLDVLARIDARWAARGGGGSGGTPAR